MKLEFLYFVGLVCILIGTVLFSLSKPKSKEEINEVKENDLSTQTKDQVLHF